ncbi:hypothetical protein BK636_13995 [Pseudomonas chlororaphis]|nr:hypothetical protein BK636_13995 [Pseudomonas chlororaphis]
MYASQEAVIQLPQGERGQHADIFRCFQQPYQPKHCFQQGDIDFLKEKAKLRLVRDARRRRIGDDLSDFRGLEIKTDTQVGRIRAGHQDAPGNWKCHRYHQVTERVVQITVVTQTDFFLSLHDQAKCRLVDGMDKLRRCVKTNDMQGRYRGLIYPGCGKPLRQQANQFVTVDGCVLKDESIALFHFKALTSVHERLPGAFQADDIHPISLNCSLPIKSHAGVIQHIVMKVPIGGEAAIVPVLDVVPHHFVAALIGALVFTTGLVVTPSRQKLVTDEAIGGDPHTCVTKVRSGLFGIFHCSVLIDVVI